MKPGTIVPAPSDPDTSEPIDWERIHLRWVDATYGRDGADSVLLYRSTHAKLEAAWYALATVAQWDAWAEKRLAELQAME